MTLFLNHVQATALKGIANMLLNIQKSKIGSDVVVLGVAGRITLGRECQEVEYQVQYLLNANENIIFDFSRLEYSFFGAAIRYREPSAGLPLFTNPFHINSKQLAMIKAALKSETADTQGAFE